MCCAASTGAFADGRALIWNGICHLAVYPQVSGTRRTRAQELVLRAMTAHAPHEHDYYRILDVKRAARPSEITAAYHLLARRYHPDVGPPDADALARFKLINEAYEVLSDAQRRREYDRQQRAAGRIPGVFSEHVSGTRSVPMPGGQRPSHPVGQPVYQVTELELPIAPEEARFGGKCDFVLIIPRVCERCSGGRPIVGDPCPRCRGRGLIDQRHRLNIHLPPGLQTGSLIRLTGHGPPQLHESSEELFLRILVRPCW